MCLSQGLQTKREESESVTGALAVLGAGVTAAVKAMKHVCYRRVIAQRWGRSLLRLPRHRYLQ